MILVEIRSALTNHGPAQGFKLVRVLESRTDGDHILHAQYRPREQKSVSLCALVLCR